MKIRHKDHGEVDGVEACYVSFEQQGGYPWPAKELYEGWMKSNLFYQKAAGWSEVPETRLVDVTGEVNIGKNGKMLVVPLATYPQHIALYQDGYTFAKVGRYDLPEDLPWRLENKFPLDEGQGWTICHYLEEFKKPHIIIQKEEPCP